MATDKELLDQMVAAAHKTTVGYVNKHWKPPPPAGTQWATFDSLAAELGAQLDGPPVPPEPAPGPGSTSSLWVCRHNPGTIAQVTNLSRYSLISIPAPDKGRLSTIRQQAPDARVICYRNGSFVTDYATSRDANCGVTYNDAVSNNWILKDGSGQPLRTARYSGQFFLDISNNAFRQKWISNVTSWAKEDGFDGVFVDDVNPNVDWHLGGQPYPPKFPNRAAYSSAMGAWVAAFGPALTGGGLFTIPNIGAAWDEMPPWKQWTMNCSGAVREHFMAGSPPYRGADWGIHAQVEQDVLSVGKPFFGLTFGAANTADQRYVRASFLLFHEPSKPSAYAWDVSDTGGADPWNSSWTFDLGLPLGAAVKNGAVWTRKFQQRTVTVDTTAGTSTVSAPSAVMAQMTAGGL